MCGGDGVRRGDERRRNPSGLLEASIRARRGKTHQRVPSRRGAERPPLLPILPGWLQGCVPRKHSVKSTRFLSFNVQV